MAEREKRETEHEELQHRQHLAEYAWGFCQSMGVKNLDIPTEKGSKVTLEAAAKTLRTTQVNRRDY